MVEEGRIAGATVAWISSSQNWDLEGGELVEVTRDLHYFAKEEVGPDCDEHDYRQEFRIDVLGIGGVPESSYTQEGQKKNARDHVRH